MHSPVTSARPSTLEAALTLQTVIARKHACTKARHGHLLESCNKAVGSCYLGESGQSLRGFKARSDFDDVLESVDNRGRSSGGDELRRSSLW